MVSQVPAAMSLALLSVSLSQDLSVTAFPAPAATTATSRRRFQFVPYGETAPPNDESDDSITIACDGRVLGATLEVSHWTGNETPQELYADTSTEIALNLAALTKGRVDDIFPGVTRQQLDSATILNNHYDTDGVASVFACLDPQVATEYKDLLIAAAEAGDFGEWSSDDGVKLDLILSNMWEADEGKAYERALEEIPKILKDLQSNEGAKYKDLWEEDFEDLLVRWEEVLDKKVSLKRANHKDIILVDETKASSRLPPYVVHRALKENNLWKDTTRLLRYTNHHGMNSDQKSYCYEKIGHGWVSQLKDRRQSPNVDKDRLVTRMNESVGQNFWTTGGPGGMISICQTDPSAGIDLDAMSVADLLAEADEGCETPDSQ